MVNNFFGMDDIEAISSSRSEQHCHLDNFFYSRLHINVF